MAVVLAAVGGVETSANSPTGEERGVVKGFADFDEPIKKAVEWADISARGEGGGMLVGGRAEDMLDSELDNCCV